MRLEAEQVQALKPESMFYLTKKLQTGDIRGMEFKCPFAARELVELKIKYATRESVKRVLSLAPNLEMLMLECPLESCFDL